MANLNETPIWEEGIFQLEKTTPPLGGAPAFNGANPIAGHANVQALQLANRTLSLNQNKVNYTEISPVSAANKIPRAGVDGKIDVDWLPNLFMGNTKSLEQLGVSASNTPIVNGEILVAAIQEGVYIIGAEAPYSFEFDGNFINISSKFLAIDLGNYVHNFKNWGGILGNDVTCIYYNGRVDAMGGYCKGFGSFKNLQRGYIKRLEFQNVFLVNPPAERQFFALEYSAGSSLDNTLMLEIESIYIYNVKTQTYAASTGNAIPMTVLGNYGSSSTQIKPHQINIGNFHVEEYYSVNQDGLTPVDGDSDVLRMFTNPTQITITNIYAKNFAKRFFKTQESVVAAVQNVFWSNDTRFPGGVFIGFFEGQLANSNVPTHFEVGTCSAYYAGDDTIPLLFNASGLPHTIRISTLRYRNIGFFSSNQNIGINITEANGYALSIQATASKNLQISKLIDTGIRAIVVAEGILENAEVGYNSLTTSTSFFITGLHLKRVSLLGWRTDKRVIQFLSMEDVKVVYSTAGTAYVRAFQPISGGIRRVEGLSVTDNTNTATVLFEPPGTGGSGTLVIRNFRGVGTNLQLGFINSGSWEVRLDDCSPSTFTGSGASIKTVTYT